MTDDRRSWYAVHVRSNQEKNVTDFVRGRNVEVFWPTYRVQSKRQDRRVILQRSLFPGYIFVFINLRAAERVEVLKAPGTVRIVSFGEDPPAIPDRVIESLKILVGDGDGPARPHPLIRVGDPVKVVAGPFLGAVGILHQTEDKKPKLVVEIDFLGRAVAVPILPEQIQPVSE